MAGPNWRAIVSCLTIRPGCVARGTALSCIGLLAVIALMPVSVAVADCMRDQAGSVMCGAGQCERDQHGDVFCAPVGGGAVRDRYGNVQCGVGQCVRDSYGKVYCSVVPGGGAATDGYGKVKCYRGCAPATGERCEPGR